MSLRFRRSFKLLPGIRLNLGKTGIGLSAGFKGLHVGINSHGQRYTSAGIPGTGLSMREYSKRSPRPSQHPQPDQQTADLTGVAWGIAIGLAVLAVLCIVGFATH